MKINKYIFVLLFFQMINSSVFSQDTNIIYKEFLIDEGDTLLLTKIPTVDVLSFKDQKERRLYYILKRKVLKVYPYAIYTKEKLEEIEKELDSISRKRKKKKHTKKVTKFLKEELGEELKKLTRTEGNILVKLIYRETKISTYKLLKQYRGSVNAFFWQTMAKIYDNNLKQEYNPVNNREDMLIEHIIINAKLEGKLE
ncbi:MAG: DUF4294 domain-containing protein [Flavobacteriales bacterium]|jgi:hypothetical protein|nr:DUF4294 domain-containing protein [Flavobacteriales bacterium]MBT7481429.1 DUF4294 domain-containing protein [Flavobacteriales bacterium]